MEKPYQIFTFGSNHIGEKDGSLGRCYMKVEGEWSQARSTMFKYTQGCFAFQYDCEDDAGVDRFNLRQVDLQVVKRRMEVV